jgi:hypothetical protein
MGTLTIITYTTIGRITNLEANPSIVKDISKVKRGPR